MVMPADHDRDRYPDEFSGFVERRRPTPVQRDWLGHVIMFFGTVLVIVGAVFSAWVTINSSLAALSARFESMSTQVRSLQTAQESFAVLSTKAATLTDRMERDERDIADLRAGFISTGTALQTVSNQLSVLDERIKDFTDKRH